MDTRAYGADLDAEHLADLLVRQALDVAEHHGNPELGLELTQRQLDVVVEDLVGERQVGWQRGAGQPVIGVVRQGLEADPAPAPRLVEEEVGGDPVQPALEGARAGTSPASGTPGRRPPGSGPRPRGGSRSAGRPAGTPAPSGRARCCPSSAGPSVVARWLHAGHAS